jgi:uncharacterized repeat protein (TIGR01451 family)
VIGASASEWRVRRTRALIGAAAILATIAVAITVAPASASAATAVQCGYGTGGTQASTLCWLDMSAYSFAQSSSAAGQPMTVSLPGGYTISFTVTTRANGGRPFSSLNPVPFPTWPGAYIGNHAYTATPGKPALYQTTNSGGDLITLTNIAVTDSTGAPINGYGFVVADAESTDTSESTTYGSNVPLKQISTSTPQFPYCGAGLTGVGTTSVTCTGGQTGTSGDGAIVLQADTPTQISAAMLGGGLQAVSFAIVTSKLTVNKVVVGRVKATDSFNLAASSPEGTAIGSATTGSGNSASTGSLTVLPRTDGSAYTLSEAPTPGSGTLMSDYSQSWSCTNAATGSTTPLPSGSGSSVQVAPAPGDDITCTVTNTQLPADLSLTATPASSTVQSGDDDTYKLVVGNAGPSSATNAVVSFKLPPGATFVSAGPNCTFAAGTVTCTAASVAAGGSTSFSVVVKVGGTAPATLAAPGSVTSATPDSNPANNTADPVIMVTPTADLSLTKSASPVPGVPGTNETFTLKAHNAGPDQAQNLKVSDPLPAGLSYQSASAGCAFAGGTVTCTAPSLAAGDSQTFTVVGRLDSSLTVGVVNTATVASSTTDPNPNNNSAIASAPLGPEADLSITKTASTPSLVAGGQVTYTLTVEDNGPSDASGVTVSDPVPAGQAVVSATPSQGSCSIAAGVVCALGTLANGGSAQVLVVANVKANADGQFKNTASVTSGQPDPAAGNNTAATGVAVTPPVVPPGTPPSAAPPSQPASDLAIVKRASLKTAYPGQRIRYTLRVSNAGPDAAPDVKLTDTPALGLKVVSIHAGRGTCQTGTPIRCSLGRIGAGAHTSIVIVAEVQSAGRELNAASVTTAGADRRAENNLSDAKTIIRPILVLRKTASGRSVRLGHDVHYRLTVGNPTSIAVGHVTVCDSLPTALVFVAAHPMARLSVGRYCFSVHSLGAHGSRSFTLIANAAPGHSGRVVNRATATAPGARSAKASATVKLISPPPTVCVVGSARSQRDAAGGHRPIAHAAC